MDIHSLRRVVPSSIRERIKNTPLAFVYYSGPVKSYRGKNLNGEELHFTINGETIELLVPDSSGLYDLSESGEIYEPVLVKELVSSIDSDSIYYDVGAGYGYNAKIALASGATPSRIHLLEADQFRFEVLKRNVPKTLSLTRKFVSDNNNENNLTIDKYVSDSQPPDILTIDVEGAEMKVLRGMSDTLNEESLSLYIELHPDKMDTETVRIFDYLDNKGYDMRIVNHREQNSNWQDVSDRLPLDYSTPTPTCLLHASKWDLED